MQPNASILPSLTKVVIFDLDGTLYHKKGMVCRMMCAAPWSWRRMLADRKVRKLLRGKWLTDEETFYQTYFQTMAIHALATPNELRCWYFDCYMPLMVRVIQKKYKPVEWFASFAEECKSRGIRMIVLSDYGHTREKLQALGIEEKLFDWVVSAPELGGLKPAAELMHKVVQRLGVSPEECLVIGDREDTDGELARAVGATYWRCNS